MVGAYFKCACVLLAMTAAMTLGGSIGDVIYTITQFCNPPDAAGFCPLSAGAILTWVAPGIWGSILVMATSAIGLSFSKSPTKRRSNFITFALLSAAILTPAIVVVNAVEVYMIISTSPGPQLFDLNATPPSGYIVKFILPVAVAGIGLIEFLLSAGLLIYACAANLSEEDEMDETLVIEPEKSKVLAPREDDYDVPPRPRPAPINTPGFGYYYPTRIYQLPTRVPGRPSFAPSPYYR